MSEQTATISFIDQLEAAALGKNIPIPNPVAKHAPKFNRPATHTDRKKDLKKGKVKHKKDIYEEEVKPIAYIGSVDGALSELSTLFENAFNVSLEDPETHLEPISAVEDEIVPFIEPVNLDEGITPTISPEAVENATSELMNLFELMAGVDLTTGEKIEEPITEEVIDIPVPLPTTYSTILNGSRNLNDVVALPKVSPTISEKQNAAADILMRDWKGDLEGSRNAKAARVITDVTDLLERHRNEMPEEEYKILEGDAVEKTVKYINDLQLDEAETYTNTQSMPLTGANMPLVSGPQFTFAVGNILRKMMATGPGSGVAEVAKLVDIDESTLTDGYTLQYKPNVAPTKYPFKWVDPSSGVGDITGVIAGTGLSGGGLTGTVTLNVEASQTQITSLGTITTGTWQGTAVANAYLGTGINATKLADGSVTNTELQYINTLSSNAQTQITAKAGKSFVTAMAVALG